MTPAAPAPPEDERLSELGEEDPGSALDDATLPPTPLPAPPPVPMPARGHQGGAASPPYSFNRL